MTTIGLGSEEGVECLGLLKAILAMERAATCQTVRDTLLFAREFLCKRLHWRLVYEAYRQLGFDPPPPLAEKAGAYPKPTVM
jgi:hypothetical protein